jgi:hypothetical protein
MVLHIKYLKQKMGQDQLADLSHYGVNDGARTHDPRYHKPML